MLAQIELDSWIVEVVEMEMMVMMVVTQKV
jgi:hypothetical protein